MKKLSLIIAIVLFAMNSYSQTTNILEQNGNVGIGINPQYKLHIQANHYKSQFLLHSTGGGTSERMADLFLWASEPGLTYSGTGIGNNVNNVSTTPYLKRINTTRGGSYVRLLDGEIKMNIIKTNGLDINTISINNSGNVGIGTSAPTTTLDINGNVNLNNQYGHSGHLNPGYYLHKNGTTAYGMKLQYTAGEFGTMIFGPNQSNRFIGFGKVGSELIDDKIIEYMRIDLDNGNVGIGTTTTGTHKLAVNGTIGAREIKVEATGWSDFVFDDHYQLKNLEEVESFIKDNKHLPDVPSEKEVLENGIQLGEMDARLLQKIEELTLYVIEQNKTIKEMQAVIERNNLK